MSLFMCYSSEIFSLFWRLIMEKALVILCGGKSSRMGTDKALLPFGDYCLIEFLVNKFKPYFSKIYLSVQQKGDYAHLNLSVTEIPDIYLNSGPLAGIFSSLSLINEDCAFIMSVDTPFVEPSLACTLLKNANDCDIYAVERTNKQLETLSAVYSKNCITTIGKCLLLHQYSLSNLHDKCNTIYVSEATLDKKCPISVKTQFFNMNTRAAYYHALRMLADRHLLSFNFEESNFSLDSAAWSNNTIPIISFVGNSGVGKTTYLDALIPLLKKDGIKAAVIHCSQLDFSKNPSALLSHITNVDLILTEGYIAESYFKIEVLKKGISETSTHSTQELIATVSNFNYKSNVPDFDYNKPKNILGFLREFIRDYSH